MMSFNRFVNTTDEFSQVPIYSFIDFDTLSKSEWELFLKNIDLSKKDIEGKTFLDFMIKKDKKMRFIPSIYFKMIQDSVYININKMKRSCIKYNNYECLDFLLDQNERITFDDAVLIIESNKSHKWKNLIDYENYSNYQLVVLLQAIGRFTIDTLMYRDVLSFLEGTNFPELYCYFRINKLFINQLIKRGIKKPEMGLIEPKYIKDYYKKELKNIEKSFCLGFLVVEYLVG